MKQMLTISMILFMFCSHAQSQNSKETQEEFKQLISYFIKAEDDRKNEGEYGPHVNIPEHLYCKFFNEKISEYDVSIEASELIKKENPITVVVIVGHPQGSYTASELLCSFTDEGKIIDKRWIGFSAIDADGGPSSSNRLINDSILMVKKFEMEFSDNYECIVINRFVFYLITDTAIIELEENQVDFGRLFPYASNEIINIEELELMSSEDLDIMRNEIFAIHGYDFKSNKWREYFNSQNWYNPSNYFSIEHFSEIERKNIDLILKVSKSNIRF
jgi:hypothetical protein